MRLWNLKGVRTSLVRGPKSTVPGPSNDSVFKMGAAIPIFSRIFMNQRIRHREAAIRKIGSRLKELVANEEGKIEKVIAAAEKTDLHSVVRDARALREQLNDAACTKVKFTESSGEEAEDGSSKTSRVKKVVPLQSRCVRAIVKGVFDTTKLTGKTTGSMKDGTADFKDTMEDLRDFLEICVKNNGTVKIPAGVVDSYGVKTGDVEIKVEN